MLDELSFSTHFDMLDKLFYTVYRTALYSV